ncbi:hypothetical protein C8J36_12318 [Rhizobium sp. PP-F2F-G48]|uniref:hypothetical protein n=1 Tax=Rhizobium sp. PP-F2F-G48 TaxID=2135651 RepID=UPI00104C98CC|nr:hypothetical protein [Rhizobium sp. PP-F2F-G48]TCM44846.1 hypothetical protein C8J36_12318 [Rhizobium sp. PP-F2F-G48]
MPEVKNYSSFYVMVVDQDKKQFSIEGPTSNESKWHRAREEAEKEGRHIDVTALGGWGSQSGQSVTGDRIIQETLREPHLRHLKNVPAGVILGKHMFLDD